VFDSPDGLDFRHKVLLLLVALVERIVGLSTSQELERLIPMVAAHCGGDPDHAHRFEITGGLDTADVDDAPAEVSQDAADRLLRLVVVTAMNMSGSPSSGKRGRNMDMWPTVLNALTTCASGKSR
jgi:hypothetical protein